MGGTRRANVLLSCAAVALVLLGGCGVAVDGAGSAAMPQASATSGSEPTALSPSVSGDPLESAPSTTSAVTVEVPSASSESSTPDVTMPFHTLPDLPTSSSPSETPPTVEVPTSADVPAQEGKSWQSPSGNIRCSTGGGNLASCTVVSIEFAGPAECPSGPVSVTFPTTGGQVVGCSDESAPTADVLGYGEEVTDGPVTCRSAESGMTCFSSVDGSGFSAARSGITDLGGKRVLTPEGLGAIEMGMTVDEVAAVEPNLSMYEDSSSGWQCRSGSIGYAEVLFNPDGTLSLISQVQGQVGTAEGLSIGDSASRIVELYGDQVQVLGDGSGSWLGVELDAEAGLGYWINTNFFQSAQEGDDPFGSGITVTGLSLNRDQMCVS